MRCDPLPKDFCGDRTDIVRCPWCRLDAGSVSVDLEPLLDAHADGGLVDPTRGPFDQATPFTLTANCLDCHRPFMIGLAAKGRYRLMAVRTEADAMLQAAS